jgi:VIT1/CCC1 family predicted Fe2+/Mn2+ transporter
MLTIIKTALKSRTVLFALLVAVLSVLQGFVGLLPLTPVHQMYVGLIVSVCVVILRSITSTPLLPVADK